MKNFEKNEVIEIMNFLVKNGDILRYEIQDNKIKVKTNLKDEEELDFLKFRIMSAIVIVNQNLENILDIEFME